jgi:hypothetical protein
VNNYITASHQLVSHEQAIAIYEENRARIKKFFTDIIDEFGDKWIEDYIKDQISIYYGIIPLYRCNNK